METPVDAGTTGESALQRRLVAGSRVVVTGAGGYSGRELTRRLLAQGLRVCNLTGHPQRPTPFGQELETQLMDFRRPERLEQALRGAAVLFNTYWVRFPFRGQTHAQAVQHSTTLFEAARRAGVERIVHTSIANPSLDSDLSYYRGKAQVERALRATGVPAAILRPTVLFGEEDVLVNNIAFFVRRFPLFLVPGDGRYRLQPMHVHDFVELMIAAAQSSEPMTVDAVGPEVYSFDELLRRIARSIGRRVLILHTPRSCVHLVTTLFSLLLRDVLLTRQEIDGLMRDLLVSPHAPTGSRRLSEWLEHNARTVGRRYASEVARHYRR